MSAIAERNWINVLFRPFVFIAGGKALGLGIAVIVLTAALGFVSATHVDGVLDLHAGAHAPFWFFVVEGFIDWLCLALVLLVLGKVISRTSFRAIDVLGTQALARWPTILMILLTLPPAFGNYTRALIHYLPTVLKAAEVNPTQLPPLPPFSADGVYFCVATVLLVPLLPWMIVLMYQAFAISCNVRAAKAIFTFIGGLIIAEILSKIALVELIHLTR